MLVVVTLAFGAQFLRIHIDTDPENMLETDHPDRVAYARAKKDFGINDMIVVGIVDERGIFRPDALARVKRVIDGIFKIPGVITDDVISLTTTNNVSSSPDGTLKVQRILDAVPRTRAEAEEIRRGIDANPLLAEKLTSKDGKGTAIYVPIKRKDQAHRIGSAIEAIARAELSSGQTFHVAGLPTAEDTFGVEMFKQMAIVAPMAGAAIFILIWLLFRKVTFILPAMVVAMFSVVWGMGMLIGCGFTVHIMSSMIPVFLMPIAVLDAVHILSEFYDRYPQLGDKRATLKATMRVLFKPMLYTSLTTACGFGSLVFAPIPPVRVFGIFIAFGIMAAWLLTITLIPAWIMLIREDRLGRSFKSKQGGGVLAWILPRIGRNALLHRRKYLALAVLLAGIGGYGITLIKVNDNPVNWFAQDHKLRIADGVMNRSFGGTYMAYLLVEGKKRGAIKRPEVMRYLWDLQRLLVRDPAVGKTSSVADIVGQVATVLHDGDSKFRVIPERADALGQYLMLFQMSGGPSELASFVDSDYQLANIWVQMRRGDNQDMSRVERLVQDHMRRSPPPAGVTIRWSGLTYINMVWQDLMVVGMRNAVMGGAAVVLLLMIILFRSPILGLVSVLPLTFAIVLSYGLVGLMGKDYDMPIAVCSSLAIGLAVDFAIHFIQRYRAKRSETTDPEALNAYMYTEPARAISRNALVVTLGFLPLLLSNLTPYKTVGAFFALLMAVSALVTLVLLPGVMRFLGDLVGRVNSGASTSSDKEQEGSQ